MKKSTPVLFAIVLLALSSCDVLTATVPVPGQPTAVVMTVDPSTPTPLPSQTPAIIIPTATSPATATATPIPAPTRRSPYPVQLSTPVVDLGFGTISFASVPSLRELIRLETRQARQYTVSPGGEYVLAASASGTALYIRSAGLTFTWPDVTVFDLPCRRCLTITNDGSRFALLARAAGEWQVQVYDVRDGQAILFQALTLQDVFTYQPNTATLALSPDGRLLAYSTRTQPVQVLDLDSGEQVFRHRNVAEQLAFTPDGSKLMSYAGRELLFWDVTTWRNPTRIIAARVDQPWAFSPDGAYLALALPNRIQVYDLATQVVARQINLRTANTREWQEVAFLDAQTLHAYAPGSNGYTVAVWNVTSGETASFEDRTDPAPGSMEAFWAFSLPAVAISGEVDIPLIRQLRYVTPESLAISGGGYACWLRLPTGEKQCFMDDSNAVFSSDGLAFRERIGEKNTVLENWQGQLVMETGPYQVYGVNRTADFYIVDVNGEGTYLYAKDRSLPIVSLGGPLRDYAENIQYMAFITLGRGDVAVTLFDKRNYTQAQNVVQYKKTAERILKPVALSVDGGEVYFLESTIRAGEYNLNAISLDGQINLLAKITLPAEPEEMAVSPNGLFVLGLKDGSLFFYDSITGNTTLSQYAQEPISRLAFSPDGRFLAVAGTMRLSVLGIVP